MPAVLNAANEVAVEAFLAGRITFTAIPVLVEAVCGQAARTAASSPADVFEALAVDQDARNRTRLLLSGGRFTVT